MKEIRFKVEIDGKDDVKKLEKDVKTLDSTTKKTTDSTKEFNKSGKELTTTFRAGSQAVAAFQGPLGPIAGRLSSVGSLLNTVTTATTAWITKLGVLRVALLATGIGAIAVALGTLTAAFFSTQQGVDALNSVLIPFTTGLGRVFGGIQDIAKFLVSGEWRQAITSFRSLFGLFREGVEQGRELNQLQIQLELSTIAFTTSNARLNATIARSRQIIQDNTVSLEEREQALVDATNALRQRAVEEQNLLEQEIAILKSRQTINDTNREDLQELADLEARLINVKATAANEERRLLRDRERLVRERMALEGEQADRIERLIIAEREEQRLRFELIEDERTQLGMLTELRVQEAERERERRLQQAELEIEDETQLLLEKEIILQDFENKRTQIERENAQARMDIAQAEADAKIELQLEVANVFSAVSRLVGEQTALGKTLGVISATIDTYVGANKALAQGGIFGGVAAAGIIATGLANVRQILATKIPSIQGQPLGVPASSPLATSIPQPTFQPQALETVGTVFNGNLQDQRVYVVESDITDTQRRVQVNESSATI